MKRTLWNHTKHKALARVLRVSLAHAAGILAGLWQLTAKECPRGNIGRLSDEDIADWLGEPVDTAAALVAALESCRWIDRHDEHRYLIHDWYDHAEDSVHMHLARARETFADGREPKENRLAKSERRGQGPAVRGQDSGATRLAVETGARALTPHPATQNTQPRAHAVPNPCAQPRTESALPLPLPLPLPTELKSAAAAADPQQPTTPENGSSPPKPLPLNPQPATRNSQPNRAAEAPAPYGRPPIAPHQDTAVMRQSDEPDDVWHHWNTVAAVLRDTGVPDPTVRATLRASRFWLKNHSGREFSRDLAVQWLAVALTGHDNKAWLPAYLTGWLQKRFDKHALGEAMPNDDKQRAARARFESAESQATRNPDRKKEIETLLATCLKPALA